MHDACNRVALTHIFMRAQRAPALHFCCCDQSASGLQHGLLWLLSAGSSDSDCNPILLIVSTVSGAAVGVGTESLSECQGPAPSKSRRSCQRVDMKMAGAGMSLCHVSLAF